MKTVAERIPKSLENPTDPALVDESDSPPTGPSSPETAQSTPPRSLMQRVRRVFARLFDVKRPNGEAENITKHEGVSGGRPDIYVQTLVFNDGTTLTVNKNDIVVFVGPNNVGKSQVLRDVQSKALSDTPAVMFDEVTFTCDPSFPFEAWAEKVFVKRTERNGYWYYSGFDCDLYPYAFSVLHEKRKPGELSNALVRFLKTEDRLQIANPPDNIDLAETPRHPIHLLRTNALLRSKISNKFQQAFGIPLFPFERFGKRTPLVIGEYPNLTDEYPNEIEREEAVAALLRNYPHLDCQGDGMRSFAGLMLYLIIDHYNTFLIDEPESFLHPPQARLMGEIVGDLLSNDQQALLSTHSIHLLQGLLEKCLERVKIVRITRTGNKNSFSILDQTRLGDLIRDPFLKHSNLLEGLFYKNVVLCEADADCMFYSMINGAPDMKGPKGYDTLFVHCGGKHRMAAIARDLGDLDVDFRVVSDFDVINDKNTLKGLVEACGGTWSEFERDYTVLSADIDNRSRNDKTENELLSGIQSILSVGSSKPVSNNKIESIKRLLEGECEWARLKKAGCHGIPSGEPRIACDALLRRLKTIGIHVVPFGELEQFVPDCGGHGPAWIQNVLDQHADLAESVYAEAKDFVRSWNL